MIFNPQLRPKAGYTIAEVGGVEAYIPAPHLVNVDEGTYVGTGTTENVQLIFSFKPKMVFVSGEGYSITMTRNSPTASSTGGQNRGDSGWSGAYPISGARCSVKWDTNIVTWSFGPQNSTYDDYEGGLMICNESGSTYHYIAMG